MKSIKIQTLLDCAKLQELNGKATLEKTYDFHFYEKSPGKIFLIQQIKKCI